MQKKIKKILNKVFVKNAGNRVWMVSTLVLFVLMVIVGVYSYQPDFNRSVNTLLWGTQQQGQAQEKLFNLPVTVIINEGSEEQKMRMEQFLENLADPQQALAATELQPKWLDAKTPEAQQLIQQSGLKYLPQLFLDGSIEQHPQFEAMQQYITKSGTGYFIRLAPLEHLEIPTATVGHVQGADPSTAKVVIQAYESYSCDHCAEANETLKRVISEYPTVSVVYKHFEPGDVYNFVAQGAECAGDQNKFFEMQEAIFKGQADMLQKMQTFTIPEEATASGRTVLESHAQNIRLNLGVFRTCLDEKIHYKAVGDQTLDAIDYGVNGPPAFFINKNYQNGLLSYDEFKSIIEEELKK